MSSYNELIALINGCINRNGVQAITGRVLNGVLRAMVNQLGAGYAMGGVAHPTDDPGTPEAPVCYYASEVGTYTHFGNIQIVPGELALLCFDLTDGWFKETMYEGFESVQATIDGNVGTPAVNVTYVNGVLSFEFSNMKGNTGAAAGFGNVTAAVDGTSGTPGVSVQTDGPDTAKNIAFQFTGLKGETGVTSVIATVDNTSGTPQCAVSLNGQQLTLAFTGLKGAQGDTGSSVAYPFTIVNNLTTNDATQALSAAMGVQLESEVSQLEAKVTDIATDTMEESPSINLYDKSQGLLSGYINSSGGISPGSGYNYSKPTPVTPGHYYLLTGRAMGSVGYGLIRCLDSSNNPMKVRVASTGNEYSYWELPNEAGTSSVSNGEFLVPEGAVSVQFNITWNNTGNDDSVMLIDLGESYVETPNTPTYIEHRMVYALKGLPEVIEKVEELDETVGYALGDTMETSPSVNIYDKEKGLIDGYINSSGGISQQSGYGVTKPTPVTPGHYYYLSGRTNTSGFDIRCLDSSNNPMKVLIPSTGEEYSGWSLPSYDGSTYSKNGEFLVPVGAVSVQFTVMWNSVGNDDSVMLIDLGEKAIENPVIPDYVGHRDVYSIKGLQDVIEKADELDSTVNGVKVSKTATIAYNAEGKYINGANQNGTIMSYAALALAYFPIKSGIRYHITVGKTTNSAGWELGYATKADGSTAVQVLADYGKGTWASAVFDLDSTFTGYLAVGYATETALPIVTYTEQEGGLVNRVTELEATVNDIQYPPIKTSVMFFGDSLTSAATTGVDGFAKRIASWLNLPYRRFILDSDDGNTDDVPVDYSCYTNYAKDGTRNRVVTSRPKPDSVIERVKRHITADTNVSIVLVECCVNDMADADAKGTISNSYTAEYDLETTLGAIEETCRYLTTLGKPLRVGFYIPWKITWGNPSFFDDHILVFKKWGIPYLDLRETAGFDMRDCVAHRIYSLTSEDVPNYDPTATYNTDDMVKYGGMLYKCKNDNVTGIVPTNAEYWIEMPGGSHDGTHLNNLGHEIVEGKIRAFLESL